jgi:hypothetical protein
MTGRAAYWRTAHLGRANNLELPVARPACPGRSGPGHPGQAGWPPGQGVLAEELGPHLRCIWGPGKNPGTGRQAARPRDPFTPTPRRARVRLSHERSEWGSSEWSGGRTRQDASELLAREAQGECVQVVVLSAHDHLHIAGAHPVYNRPLRFLLRHFSQEIHGALN